MNEGERRDARRIGFDPRDAARRAQELVLAARAIESRVSALGADTPEPVVEETALLIKAAALQIVAIVHDLLAQGERFLVHVSVAHAGSDAFTSEAALSSTSQRSDPSAPRDS